MASDVVDVFGLIKRYKNYLKAALEIWVNKTRVK